jgi:hypothetical protein
MTVWRWHPDWMPVRWGIQRQRQRLPLIKKFQKVANSFRQKRNLWGWMANLIRQEKKKKRIKDFSAGGAVAAEEFFPFELFLYLNLKIINLKKNVFVFYFKCCRKKIKKKKKR